VLVAFAAKHSAKHRMTTSLLGWSTSDKASSNTLKALQLMRTSVTHPNKYDLRLLFSFSLEARLKEPK
jgi:hypothetical protein